jgi:hypothetical protein
MPQLVEQQLLMLPIIVVCELRDRNREASAEAFGSARRLKRATIHGTPGSF